MTSHLADHARPAAIASLLVACLMPLHIGWGQETSGERTDDQPASSAVTDEGSNDAETEVRTDASADAAANFDAKRPSILGMTVIEDESGRPAVVDVGAATPAWDAGVRKGDVIVSLHGVESKSFQEWVDGVKKVVADAVDGQTVPMKLLRDGEPLDLRVRLPVSQAGKIPRSEDRRRTGSRQQAAGLPQAPAAAAGTGYAPGDAYPPGGAYPAGGGVGIGIGDDGGFAGAPIADDRVPMRAAAQLFAVQGAAGRGVAAGAALPTGQVGSAEFSDEASGLRAVISLVGLPPGRYRVGIGEIAGGAVAGPQGGWAPVPDGGVRSDRFHDRRQDASGRDGRAARPTPGDRRRQVAPTPVDRGGALPPDAQPGGSPTPVGTPRTAPTQPGGTPAGSGVQGAGGGGGAGGGAPAGSSSQLSVSRNTILAQVTPGSSQTPANPPAAGNANTGQVPSAAARPTGPTQNPPLRPLPQPEGPRGARELGSARADRASRAIDAGVGGAGMFGLDLGVVNVGVGGGQAHQRLEGIRVASIVGQSVIVVPADDTGAVGVAADPRLTGNAQRSLDRSRRDAVPDARNNLGVVAAGVIRALPTGRSAAASSASDAPSAVQPGQTDAEGNVQPPAATEPAPASRNANQSSFNRD